MFFFYLFFIKTYQLVLYLYHKLYIYTSQFNRIFMIINHLNHFNYNLFFSLKFINNASTSWAWGCFPLRCNHLIVFFR